MFVLIASFGPFPSSGRYIQSWQASEISNMSTGWPFLARFTDLLPTFYGLVVGSLPACYRLAASCIAAWKQSGGSSSPAPRWQCSGVIQGWACRSTVQWTTRRIQKVLYCSSESTPVKFELALTLLAWYQSLDVTKLRQKHCSSIVNCRCSILYVSQVDSTRR